MATVQVSGDRGQVGGAGSSPTSRRPGRLLSVAGWTLIWLGAILLGYIGYQLWGTGWYTQGAQQQLEERLEERLAERAVVVPAPLPEVEATEGAPQASQSPAETVPAPPPLIVETAPAEGEPIGRIIIPSAEVDDVMVEGVGVEDLKKGPGHMPWTPLPGQPGNAVLSGHRTTYGAPFFYLDQVEVGDDIYVETLIGRHTYRVREILVVEPTDVWVTDPRPGAWLTLTTCTPRYSAAQRLVIFAELVDGPNFAAVAATVAPDTLKPAA